MVASATVWENWKVSTACRFESNLSFMQDGMPRFCLALSCVCWSRWGETLPLFLLHLISLTLHTTSTCRMLNCLCRWGGNINPCSITRPNIIPRSVINISTLLPLSLHDEENAKCFFGHPNSWHRESYWPRHSLAKLNWNWNDCNWTRLGISIIFFPMLSSSRYIILNSPLNWIWSKILGLHPLPKVTLPFSHVLPSLSFQQMSTLLPVQFYNNEYNTYSSTGAFKRQSALQSSAVYVEPRPL